MFQTTLHTFLRKRRQAEVTCAHPRKEMKFKEVTLYLVERRMGKSRRNFLTTLARSKGFTVEDTLRYVSSTQLFLKNSKVTKWLKALFWFLPLKCRFVSYLNVIFDCLCQADYSKNSFHITLYRLSIWYASICMQITMIMWRYLAWFLRTPKRWQDNDREDETLSGSVRWRQSTATIKLFLLQNMTLVNPTKPNFCMSIVTGYNV